MSLKSIFLSNLLAIVSSIACSSTGSRPLVSGSAFIFKFRLRVMESSTLDEVRQGDSGGGPCGLFICLSYLFMGDPDGDPAPNGVPAEKRPIARIAGLDSSIIIHLAVPRYTRRAQLFSFSSTVGVWILMLIFG